jgi:hypothetical protein
MARSRALLLVAMLGLALASLPACGDDSSPGDGSTDTGADADADADVTPPPAVCDPFPLVDVSSPTTVVGGGTPASCTAELLQTAASAGGTITFDCGPDPVTITVSSTITFTGETILDGGGLVTLSGGGAARILYLDSGYDRTTPRLTVQRLTFRDGASQRGADDTAGGGAAIYRDGGSLTVIDCAFIDNHAPPDGQDLAGGAIYGFGGGDIIVSGSTFTGNSASDGGAIGSLNGDLTLINTTFTDNHATGTGGNPGNGGCGGAIYQDGADERTSLCGVTIESSTAGAIGGGFFRVSNDHTGTFTMDRTTVDDNRVTSPTDGNAGGLYLEGLALTVTNSTISRNQAFYNGGIWISTATVQMTNTTISGNVATGSNGGGLWLSYEPTGMLLNCTIADNHADADGQGAGAVFGAGPGLVLKNTLFTGNTGWWGPNCESPLGDGGGNIQWTDAAPCASGITTADPLLGALGANGGETETMVPGAGSPAIGLGTDCPPTDQRGEPRSAASCTAGAVEVP